MSTEPISGVFPDRVEGIRRLPVGGGLQVAPDEEAVLEKEGLAAGESEGVRHSEGVGELALGVGQ